MGSGGEGEGGGIRWQPCTLRSKASAFTQEQSRLRGLEFCTAAHCLTIQLANATTVMGCREVGAESEEAQGWEIHLDAISLARVNRADRSACRQPGTG